MTDYSRLLRWAKSADIATKYTPSTAARDFINDRWIQNVRPLLDAAVITTQGQGHSSFVDRPFSLCKENRATHVQRVVTTQWKSGDTSVTVERLSHTAYEGNRLGTNLDSRILIKRGGDTLELNPRHIVPLDPRVDSVPNLAIGTALDLYTDIVTHADDTVQKLGGNLAMPPDQFFALARHGRFPVLPHHAMFAYKHSPLPWDKRNMPQDPDAGDTWATSSAHLNMLFDNYALSTGGNGLPSAPDLLDSLAIASRAIGDTQLEDRVMEERRSYREL